MMFVLALAGIELTRLGDRIASVWLANGAILALILHAPRREWPALLATAFAANIAANLAAADTLVTAFALAGSNLLEIGLVAVLLGHRGGRPFASLAGILRFSACAALACLLSGAMATIIVASALDWSALGLFGQWVMADLFGLLMITPLALTWLERDSRLVGLNDLLEPLAFIIVTALLTTVIFRSTYPQLFLICPVLLFAGFRLRVRSASLVAAIAAAVAVVTTFSGHGPIANALLEPEQKILLLQAFFAVALILTIPISAVNEERDRLNRALNVSERQFRLMAESSPAGILQYDIDGVPLYLNARWTELTGMGLDEIRMSGWECVVADNDRQRATALWQQVRGRVEEGIDCLPCAIVGRDDGWAEISISPERTEDGALVGWVVRLSDVSERTRVGNALGKSEELYRLLAENARDIIMRLSLDGTKLFVSAASRTMLGVDPDQMVGKPLSRFIHPSDWAQVRDNLHQTISGQSDQAVRYRNRRADGRYLWVEAVYHLVRDSTTGIPVEIIATVRDIDRRHKAELVASEAARKLRKNVRLLEMAEDLASVGHWHFDGAEDEYEASAQAMDIAGIDRSGTVTRAAAMRLVAPQDRGLVRAAIMAALRGQANADCRARIIRPDGEERFVQIAAQSPRDADGAISGVFGVIHDITKKVADERELLKAADAKSVFLATMSHEIRTPMTGVLGMIDLLGDSPSEQERVTFLATLKQSAHLLMTVLNDVLDFSKIEHGRMRIQTCDFDFEALAQSTIDLFFNAASSKGLLISLALDSGSSPFVHGDPVRIQQVMSNLITNAIKFTDQGSVIIKVKTFAVATGQQLWRVEVRDTGVGIAADEIERMFDPFIQAEQGGGARFAGVGLGLAISRKLVEAMDGTLGINSVLGAGTTSWFEISLDEAAGATKRATPVPVAQPAVRPLNVLVAEDNPVNQLLVTALLRRQGHVAYCVENGLKAVEAAATTAYDCVLMDMQMPEMDGITATRTIRQSGGPCANIPIIALTADASPERRRFYDNAGLTGFMTKPIDADALAGRLARIANASAAEPELDSAPASIDEDYLNRLRAALGPKRFSGLIDLFLAELDERPGLICEHLLAGRLDLAKHEAHSLKGAALSIGATTLGDIAYSIEQLPTATDTKANTRLLDDLDGQVHRLRTALTRAPDGGALASVAIN